MAIAKGHISPRDAVVVARVGVVAIFEGGIASNRIVGIVGNPNIGWT